MGNPWTDPDKARRWQPTGKPGQVHREEALRVVFALCDVHAPRRLLDLGCGIGDIDARLLARYPQATLVGLDASPGMLGRARETLRPYADRAELVEADLEEDWRARTGAGFDVVLATQSVHHVEAAGKRALFERVLDVLAPGGLFVLNDKIRFSAALYPHHVALWNEARARHGFEPCPPGEGYEAWREADRAGGDVPDALAEQLDWLRAAGFAAAESFWQHGDKAVDGALKASAGD